MEDFIVEYLEKLTLTDYKGIGLIGSYANNTYKKWSDVDLICIVEAPRTKQIEIYKNTYFSINYYMEEDFEVYLKNTGLQLNGLEALKGLKIIYDPNHYLERVKKFLEDFTATTVDREKSLYLAKTEYIGFIEAAQKALQGLMDNHKGKMLNGLYGLTYGMFSVIRLRDYISIKSDNDFYDCVLNSLDDKDPIKMLAPQAFGIEHTTLIDQVEAGLELFMHIGNSLVMQFSEEEKKYGLKLINEIIKVV